MKWISRGLFFSPYYFALCLSESKFQKELKKKKIPKEEWPDFLSTPQADATIHYFEAENGSYTSAIICLGDTGGRTIEEIYGLLVHEATHLWQAIREHIGEKNPSYEFEAYSMQNISQNLFEAYKEMINVD